MLRQEAGVRGLLGVTGAVFLELQAKAQLFGLHFRQLLGDSCAESFGSELFVDFVLNFGLLVIASDGGGGGFLIEEFTVDLDLQVLEVCSGGFQLIFSVQDVALQFRVGQFQDHATRPNESAGM